jgi:DNA polymerase bacteriophage-type
MIPLPPPPLHELRAGTQLVAGLGVSTILPDLDFETYSPAGFVWDDEAGRWRGPTGASQGKKGLFVVGAAVYTADPGCEVLSMAYDLKDGRGRRHWHPGMPLPGDLLDHIAGGGLLEAWNVAFERWVWENVCVPKFGWPAVHPDQWRCAMAKARAHALPGGLEKAGEVLELDTQKDKDGTRLLDLFSVPQNPTKADPRLRQLPVWDQAAIDREWTARLPLARTPGQQRKLSEAIMAEHADTLKLAAYNDTDIAAEAEASSLIPDLSPDEMTFWRDDQAINKRGVRIDLESVENCIDIIGQAQRRYGEELRALTGCVPTELEKLKGWLHGQGVHLDSMDEDAVADALTWNLPPLARRALEIRAAVGSASVKKVFAMRNQASAAGRLHDLYSFHAARTGRPTGNGPQPTNLPKAGPNTYRCGYEYVNGKDTFLGHGCGRHHGAHTMYCHWCGTFTLRGPKASREWSPEAMMDGIEAIGHRSLEWLEVLFGDAMLTLAGCLRGLFIAAEGHDLLSSDFTAIEGVVIACLAGEQWRIDAYANDEPMYLLSAERMFGTTVAEMKAYAKEQGRHHPLRQKGKGGELGLGFGGWINALRNFGVDGPDDELKDTVLKWRRASPALEWLWGGQKKGPADVIRQNAGLTRGADRWDKTTEYFGLEGMAISAVLNPGAEFPVLRLDGTPSGISYIMRGDALYCRVPSGGLITYHRPRLQQAAQDWRGLALSFEGWNTNPKSGPPGWIRMGTYSGKLAENVTQKSARDIQMPAIHRCEENAYPVVMHTYDEIVSEVPEGAGSVEEMESLMTTPLPWAEGWPIKAAGGWRGKRYRKA